DDQVTPVAKTGLHCGSDEPEALDVARRVTPVAKTGLHCGAAWAAVRTALSEVTPVAKTGLHCGDRLGPKFLAALTGDPGREDRAPLRHQRTSPCVVSLVVTPVAKTGLHCGSSPTHRAP